MHTDRELWSLRTAQLEFQNIVPRCPQLPLITYLDTVSATPFAVPTQPKPRCCRSQPPAAPQLFLWAVHRHRTVPSVVLRQTASTLFVTAPCVALPLVPSSSLGPFHLSSILYFAFLPHKNERGELSCWGEKIRQLQITNRSTAVLYIAISIFGFVNCLKRNQSAVAYLSNEACWSRFLFQALIWLMFLKREHFRSS